MSWVEAKDQSSARGSATVRTYSRRFIIDAQVSEGAILKTPSDILGGDSGSEPLPNYADPFPSDGAARLDNISLSNTGSHWLASFDYSTDGRGELPPIRDPENEVGVIDFSGSFQTESVDIPYAALVSVAFPGDVNASIVDRVWDILSLGVTVTRERLNYRVVIKNDIAGAIAAMADQNNKLHNLSGRWMRFEAGDYRRVKKTDVATFWELDYSWIGERGIRYANFPSEVDGVNILYPFGPYPGPLTGLPGDWVLPPHHYLIPLRAEGGATEPPEFQWILPYEPDANGWQSLKGLS